MSSKPLTEGQTTHHPPAFLNLSRRTVAVIDAAKQQMFINRLGKVYKHVGKLARKQDVSCYRVYDHNLPGFPLCQVVQQGRNFPGLYKSHWFV